MNFYSLKKMKATLFVILAITASSCEQVIRQTTRSNDTAPNHDSGYMAEKIKIDGLGKALTKLKNGQTEFPFIGITSNGVDCIYFMPENGHFDIDFEAMGLDQVPYIAKLKSFADSNKIETLVTTYGNKPNYESDKSAPVIHIETKASLEEATQLGERIQSEIFKNNKDTIYEVVP